MRLMKSLICIFVVIVLFVGTAQTAPPVRLSASIPPLAAIARDVGGRDVEVITLLPPGATPHHFEPGPEIVRALASSEAHLVVGLDLDPWAESLARAAGRGTPIDRLGRGLGDLEGDAGDSSTTVDPHVWLDPINAIHQVERIRDALIQADPAGAEIYQTNASQYVAQLRDLDGRIREKIDGLPSKKFISFHAAYSYLARRYGPHFNR